MQSFLQSAFLQALSQSLIASILQMALLFLLTILLLRLFKFSSAQKFNIAFAAQLSGFVLFVITFIYSYQNTQHLIAVTTYTGSFYSKFNSIIIEWMPYAAIIYLVALIIKVSRFIFTYNDTKGLRKYGLTKISAENRIFVQQMSKLFSLHKKVSIYLSGKINCPLTIGFFKPIILIPLAAVNHLTTEQLEAVILHELAHIKRADYLLFIIQNLIDKIFFFNVFSRMLGNIIERERENACDDWVLQFRYNSMHYAEALFKLGRLKATPALAMSLTGKKENLLLARIKRLLHNPQKSLLFNTQSFIASLVSLLTVVILLISFSVKPKEEEVVIAANIRPAINKVIIQPVAEKSIEAFKINQPEKVKTKAAEYEVAKVELPHNQTEKSNAVKAQLDAQQKYLEAKQDYLIAVQQKLDSIHIALPNLNEAVNTQINLTPELLQKAMSYQNFKQIENMLAATGDSINITESNTTKDSYKKLVTIETTDKNGNKHVYNVIVELYQ